MFAVGVVERLEYDPNRSAHIALIKYASLTPPKLAYIIASKDMQPGDKVLASRTQQVRLPALSPITATRSRRSSPPYSWI